jgi:hypothetical protein
MRNVIMWVALAGCGDKEPSTTAAPAEAKAKETVGSVAPSDPNSQKFVADLTALDIQDFHPSSSAGGQIVYSHLKFRPEGAWAATGYVEAGDEKIDCSETGTWTMDPATNETTATMTWKTATTDCAGREPGGEQRVEVTITGSTINTSFR